MGFESKYTGRVAADYDARRAQSPKWQFEQHAVAEMLRSIAPRTVLDAPVGTGRFLALYEELGIEATGIDVSLDMLGRAAGRTAALLLHADIFSFESVRMFDCVVCVRFLGWLPPAQKAQALSRLTALSSRHVLLSMTTAHAAFVQVNGAFIASDAEFEHAASVCRLRLVQERTSPARDGATARIVLLERQ